MTDDSETPRLDKQGNPVATTRDEFFEKLNANKGQWKDKEKARAAGIKSGLVRKKKADMKKKLQDKKAMIDDAFAAALEDNEDFFEDALRTLMSIVTNGGSNEKDKLAALAAISDLTGVKAPKQSEVKVEQKEMDAEEAKDILKGLKVIK